MIEKLKQLMLGYTFYDNTLYYWILAIGVAIGIYAVARIAKAIVIRQFRKLAEKTKNGWTENPVKIIDRIHPLFLLVAALFGGSMVLTLPGEVTSILGKVLFIAFLLQIGRLVSKIIELVIENYRNVKLEKNAAAVTMLSTTSLLSRILLWFLLLLLALDNFGVNVTTLLAGLGVGGIAVALAVQNILGDVFASFSIVLDKPFVIGDFIIVGDLMGTVEHVGLKTTRIRSLSGEQLIFSNDDLLRSRIRNFKRMYERRVVFSIGVVYQTPVEKVSAIPGMIKHIIEDQSTVRFDRAHFKEYGAYALNFEVVYWVLNPDYNIYMDIQQAINLGIYNKFEAEGIEFAYPTQLVYYQGQPAEEQEKPAQGEEHREEHREEHEQTSTEDA